MKKLLLIISVFITVTSFSQNIPRAVDLQAVSIDPLSPIINKKEVVRVVTVMKNNGPDTIYAGEATCIITVNNKFLAIPKAFSFQGDSWRLAYKSRTKGLANFFFKTTEAIVPGETTLFYFNVSGKTLGIGNITLGSSLSHDAKCGDVNGWNQSVSTEVLIIKK